MFKFVHLDDVLSCVDLVFTLFVYVFVWVKGWQCIEIIHK